MIVTIFGATGLTGKQLVKQALMKDWTVKAYGRNVFTAGFREDKNLQLIPGAAFDKSQLAKAIKGSDAVLSALGGGSDGVDKTRSLGMKYITEQMQEVSVDRIIAIGGMGILDAENEEIIMNNPEFPRNMIAVSSEHWEAYQHMLNSGLQWTMVCPPEIVNAASTGLYKTAADKPPVPNNFKINSGDLAMFMINELTKNDYVQHRVGISN